MIWYVILILAIIIEILTTSLMAIWFVFGALSTIIVTVFTNNLIIQISVFLIITILSFILTKKIIKKYLKLSEEKTNLDMPIAKIERVTLKNSKHELGVVNFLRKYWNLILEMFAKGKK